MIRPVDSGRVLSSNLKHVTLVGPAAGDSLAADSVAAGQPPMIESRVPTELPPLHMLIESLRLNGFDLGRLRLESHARSEGMEFELLAVEGPSLKLNGHGDRKSVVEGTGGAVRGGRTRRITSNTRQTQRAGTTEG